MTQQVFEIPLSPTPQRFSIQLGTVTYRLNVQWNESAAVWVIDIHDANDVPIVNGIPLVTGVDLLAQYVYLGFGFQLVCQTDHNTDAVPTFDNLGDTSHVFAVFNA